MGRPPAIDNETGLALLEAYRKLGNISSAARSVGVSRSTAQRYLENTSPAAAPIIAQQREVIELQSASLFDTRGALEDTYQRIQRLVQQLEDGITLVSVDTNGKEYYTSVSPAILVSAIREAREHITAGLKLYQLMLDVDEVRKFQESVLEAINEADHATRDRILEKLKERRALGLALQ